MLRDVEHSCREQAEQEREALRRAQREKQRTVGEEDVARGGLRMVGRARHAPDRG